MAKAAGLAALLKLSGKLDDFIFYERDGKIVLRQKGHISKKRYQTDPAFKDMRKNGTEFGAASSLGKVYRKALATYLKQWSYVNTCGEITGGFRDIIAKGCGELGKRSFETRYLQDICSVGLNPKKVIVSTKSPFKINHNTGSISLRIDLQSLKNKFEIDNSMPFSLVFGMLTLSEVKHDIFYLPQKPDWHGRKIFKQLDFPAKANLKSDLRKTLSFKETIPEDVGVIGIIGLIN